MPFFDQKRSLRKRLRAVGIWVVAMLLLACGGGGGGVNDGTGALLSLAPGVGTGGTGSVAGTLTGLGSVFVDGVRYDDSQAVLERQSDLVQSETLGLADLQVGQYVYMELDANGTPTRVRLESQLVGPVGSVNTARGQLTVWGQTVAVNTDPNLGPVTVFSGYADISDVSPPDPVQVYGVLQTDPADASRDIFLATRIERLTSTSTLPARLTGTLRSGNSNLLLAGLALETSQTLTAGQVVTLVIPWTQDTNPTSSKWKLQSLRVLGTPAATTSTLRLSGAVQLRPDGLLMVQGVQVDVSATALAAVRAGLRNGSYITVSGQINRSNGQLVASAIDSPPVGGQVLELRGSVTSLLDARSFIVRGMQVNASTAQWLGGTPADLVNGRYVELTGAMVGNAFRASKVVLQAGLPDKAVLDVSGLVQAVDSGNQRLSVLTQDGQTLTIAAPPMVTLPSKGDTVRIDGYWRDGTLQASDLANRAPIDQSLIHLEGIIDAVGLGQFRLNGVLVQVDLGRFANLRIGRGDRVQIAVKLTDGRYTLVDFMPQAPRH